jgi:hypothetical protein
MKWLLAIILLAAIHPCCKGQDALPLNNDYPFRDGVYMSFEEFKGDNPTYPSGQFRIDQIDSLDYDLTRVKQIKVMNRKGKWKRISISKIWGLSYDGIPYIYYRGLGTVNHPLAKMSKLTRIDVIGAICMFRMEHQNKIMNTNTFTNKMIHSNRVFVLDMLMDMNSGKVHVFDYFSVEHYIRHDEDLVSEMELLRNQVNLYDIVFAYNVRHPVYPSPVSFYEE